MKPERIEELARLSYEAPAPGRVYPPYERASWTTKEYHRKLARTLYAAAMRDAAGVARDYAEHPKPKTTEGHAERLLRIGWMTLADELSNEFETIAKETDSDHG